MPSYKQTLMYHSAAITNGIAERTTTTRGKLKKGALTLFTTADGRACALTRDAIDKGLPQAAGIGIIDGDLPDGEGLKDVECVSDDGVGPNEYRCDRCKGIFVKGWTDEQAVAEAAMMFEGQNLGPDNGALICDDCYKGVIGNRLIDVEPAGNG